jgi:hypothetical protein
MQAAVATVLSPAKRYCKPATSVGFDAAALRDRAFGWVTLSRAQSALVSPVSPLFAQISELPK